MDWDSKMKCTIGLIAGALLLTCAAQAADKKCELQKYADLPVTMSGTRPLISGTINGSPAKFLADSGAFFSMLSRDSAARYGLKVGPMPPNIRVRGTGGTAEVGLAKAKEFSLTGFVGGRIHNNVDFVVGGYGFGNDAAGIIGQNILGSGDSEYDLANGAIRVYQSKNCKGPILAYWAHTDPVAEMTIEETTPMSPHLVGQAKLNGKKIRVLFDTGAWRSLLTLNAAARAGIEPEDDGVIAAGISSGIGKRTTENSIARFDTLDLGGEVIKNARLRIGDAKLFGADMLLGADFFLSHRVFVASKQNRIFFTYNGGPVFDLRQNPTDSKSPSTNSASAPIVATTIDSAASGGDTLDAAALRRRGTASAGRHDFVTAIADFDRAVALDANDAENFYERGLARWQSGQPIGAAADFDAALKLKPDHVQALLARGSLLLRGTNDAGASADFQEALRLSPKDPAVGLRIADAYHAVGNFNVAIERLSTWIAANPKDDRVPRALNQRCWSRAILGIDLQLARADCDSALKKGAKNSAVYDSRALVLLQLGELDKAIGDYKEALELQPKKASSLYGLGLAEIKKGLKDSGQRNIQAAMEIDPTVATVYQKAGVAP
jgi:tetratricopeptide (TPR) repeat protein/predicted aspartyl protease